MTDANITEILDFAIEEEMKAGKLYEETAAKLGDNKLTPLLIDMAKMEKGHEAKLRAFKEGKPVNVGSEQVQNLKIGDYLVDVQLTEDSSIQDVLVFSIKAEMKAHELYTNLSKLYSEQNEIDLFVHLANEELKHKNDLEKAYDDLVYKEN